MRRPRATIVAMVDEGGFRPRLDAFRAGRAEVAFCAAPADEPQSWQASRAAQVVVLRLSAPGPERWLFELPSGHLVPCAPCVPVMKALAELPLFGGRPVDVRDGSGHYVVQLVATPHLASWTVSANT